MNDSTVAMFTHYNHTALGLLFQSSIILLIGHAAGRLAPGHGAAWRSLIYRAALITLALAFVTTLVFSERITNQLSVIQPARPFAEHQQIVPITAAAVRANQVQPTAIAPAVSLSNLPANLEAKTAGFHLPVGWTVVVPVAVWLLGIVIGLVWMAFCKLALILLYRTAAFVVNAEASGLLQDICGRLNIPPPALVTHKHVRSPFLAGVLKPTIYLPEDYEMQFDTATLRAVLAHEMAHMARRDCAWLLAARIAATILWWQPLVWLLHRGMIDSSEEACDAMVIELDCPPAEYAASLLSLAERLKPSQMERAYGIGVTPIKSSLGRRVQSILDSSKYYALRIPARARVAVVSVAIIGVGAAVVFFCPATNTFDMALATPPMVSFSASQWTPPVDYADQFTFAKQQRWSASPVISIATYDRPKSFLGSLPPAISARDLQLMNACQENGLNGTSSFGRGGPPDYVRNKIQNVLAGHPHFFYAEYRLAVWYAKHNQMEQYRVWKDRSLADAPAIIAGRIQYNDGRPIAGCDFTPNISFFQSDNFNENESKLARVHNYEETVVSYEEAITDDSGCYYVPVFKGIYDNSMASWVSAIDGVLTVYGKLVNTMAMEQQSTGRFTFDTHVGLLPPIVARPYIEVTGTLAGRPGSTEKPIKISSDHLNVAWRPYPAATSYEVSLREIILNGPHGSLGSTMIGSLEQEGFKWQPTMKTNLTLDLAGRNPAFNPNYIYKLTVTARQGDNQYADSRSYYFVAEKGITPLPVTKAGIEMGIPRSKVQSITHENGKLIVNVFASGVLVTNIDLKAREVFAKPPVKTESLEFSSIDHVPFHLEF